MAWGNKKRLGAKQGSQSEQFKNGKKKVKKKGSGGVGHDGRCSTCGGVDGHLLVRVSYPIYDSSRHHTGRYKIVNEKCPHA